MTSLAELAACLVGGFAASFVRDGVTWVRRRRAVRQFAGQLDALKDTRPRTIILPPDVVPPHSDERVARGPR
ncbi:MAG TPA: hypothetical protein VFQ42_04095 [Mycobacterium sp.]|nr:hypothetical protein [Mycobacterium sp.]